MTQHTGFIFVYFSCVFHFLTTCLDTCFQFFCSFCFICSCFSFFICFQFFNFSFPYSSFPCCFFHVFHLSPTSFVFPWTVSVHSLACTKKGFQQQKRVSNHTSVWPFSFCRFRSPVFILHRSGVRAVSRPSLLYDIKMTV